MFNSNIFKYIYFVFILLIPFSQYAVTYYVKTNGSDALSGTSWANAWQTIQQAGTTMVAGDTTYISNGTYNESVTVANSGSSGNPITFQNYIGCKVIMDINFSYNQAFSINNNIDYINIIGIEMRNTVTYGIYIYSSSYFYIKDCRFINCNNGIQIDGQNASLKSDYGTITNCFFSNNNRGIYFRNHNSDNLITDNIIINNGIGIEYNIWSSQWDSCYQNIIDNNTISYNTFNGITTGTTGEKQKFINNTINSNATNGIYFRDSKSTIFSNNSIIGNGKNGIEFINYDETVGPRILKNKICRNVRRGIIIRSDNNRFSDGLIYNNIIHYNHIQGIYIADLYYNSIISNSIIGTNQYYGIDLHPSSSNNMISSNYIYNNSTAGIRIRSKGNRMSHNFIYSNQDYGIEISPNLIASNSIIGNTIFGANQDHGILVSEYSRGNIYSNLIFNQNNSGIRLIEANNMRIKYNRIYNNPIGVIYSNSSISFNQNSLTNNDYGFVFYGGDTDEISYNNLYLNTRYNFSNASGSSIQITNIWWGSTVCSNIQNKLYNIQGYNNFTPYRLFGPFDIAEGSDIIPPVRITNLILNVTGCTVNLQWEKNMSATRYCVYRSDIGGTTNLERNCVVTNIFDNNITNFRDCPGGGRWFYTVTACDDHAVYTNECWYSKVMCTNFNTFITVTKSISNSILNGMDYPVVPGSTLCYQIIYSNLGNVNGKDITIYDHIPSMVTFSTVDNIGLGWEFEYSTNNNPLQDFNSEDYIAGIPIIKTNVKWIRWKKNQVNINEDNWKLKFKVIVK